ncbi:hypothetical protein CHS0354_000753 [Potamilus streckersoni]|uniref:fructose-bisphosphate aldolase n=1 Tax=Potamilus streckersoni TaxID=2493646 RepID=A0AAE0W976_9BIVA|nr:hypothetical protein CHS0354_000753 [Potamilus streckersoni]
MAIKFGTDGWRAIIAEEFTYSNLKKVSLATARYFLNHSKAKNGVCIGYDTRFMSKEFAQYSAEIMSSVGLRVYISNEFVPTPGVSLYVKKNNLAGGVVITASHNPPMYNGFKVKGDYGGPANPEMIADIEKILATVDEEDSCVPRFNDIKTVDIKFLYLNKLSELIDLRAIRKVKLKIAHHAMYGAGQGIVTALLGKAFVTEYHSEFNPSFNGINPEPILRYTTDFVPFMKKGKFDIGIVNDGDADRVGLYDEKGRFVDSHVIFSIILDYLVSQKKMTGDVAKTFTLTNCIDRICERHGLKLHLLPVGFKYVGKLMQTTNILIGGEESGGFAVRMHIPERDGIFVGLFVAEIMAKTGKSLSQLVKHLFKTYGEFHFDRIDVHLTEEQKNLTLDRVSEGKIKKINGMSVVKYENLDGDKYFFDGGWLLIRASEKYLGAEVKELLEYKAKVSKDLLHLPGSDFVDRILYPSDRPINVLRNLQSIYNTGRLSGTGYLSILPVDQGIEHSAGASFAKNPIYFDGENIVKLAIEGGCNAVASTLGVLGSVARKYAHKIPFIVKLNHNELLTFPNQFDQVMFSSIDQAFNMGAVGVGATIYFGSDEGTRQLMEVAEAFEYAHQLGMVTILWCYLRNSAFKKKDKDYHVAADLTGQANHLGVTIQADIIKQKQPENNGGYTVLNTESAYGKTDKRIYSELCSDNLIDLTRYQVMNCYMGRSGLINSGGGSGDSDFADAVKTAVINKRAGGMGLISGRKAFQRPMKEGIEILNLIQDVYLSKNITIA